MRYLLGSIKIQYRIKTPLTSFSPGGSAGPTLRPEDAVVLPCLLLFGCFPLGLVLTGSLPLLFVFSDLSS